VFLPEAVLTGKIARLTGTIAVPGKALDEASAKELYLYLVAPLQDLLDDAKAVMIVPQGPIIGLPFEALVQTGAAGFLVEHWVVSYAPNATMALDALSRASPTIKRITAILDVDIDDFTQESKGIESVPGLQLSTLYSSDVLPDKLGQSLAGAESAHLLLHGEFDAIEPLLSTLTETSRRSPPLPATTLVSLPLKGMKLVVLSACESGTLQVRISNEIYGFPWALLAGGAENVVTSRWRVDGASNGRWMQYFYTSIASGSSPAEAAAAAMREMRKENGSHPYFWAAMQVNGH
jgi:CHAT domain-containing protein